MTTDPKESGSQAAPHSVRRKSKRVRAVLPVQVEGEAQRLTGICVDLSSGGAGLHLKRLPDVGELVQIHIHLPGGAVLKAKAEVMHAGITEPERCGVRFKDLDQGALFAVHTFVAQQEEQ